MSGRFFQKSVSQPSQPTGVSPNLFRRQQLRLKLAGYRPLGILAGIWVGLLAIALLAYGQLMHTTADTKGADSPSVDVTVYPHEQLDNDAEAPTPASTDSAKPRSRGQQTKPSSPATTPSQKSINQALEQSDIGISGWTLVALVSICAVGCWVTSAQLKSPPRARHKKKPKLSRLKGELSASQSLPAKAVTAKSQLKTDEGPKRLSPYDPNQPLISAPVQQPSSQTAESLSADRSPMPAPTNVTVMAEEFRHRLDWPENSLVNEADLRQRRSLSSFL